jgi:hypothetical protein
MSLQRARYDWNRFVIGGGFETDIVLTPPDNNAVTVKGLAVKHHTKISTDGLPVNSKYVRISVSEASLVALEYPVRNGKNEVSMRKHKVAFKDSTGEERNYIIQETIPDETIGLITLLLGDYSYDC